MSKPKLQSRLSSYWKMEIANVVIVPAAMVVFCLSVEQAVGWPLFLTCIPMCGLLIIGGLYWRAKLHQLEGNRATLDQLLPHLRFWQLPLLIMTLAALALCIAVWTSDIASSTGERWSVTTAAILAALEYVNYYHRQLQHFDHWPDFQRFLSGKGFQPSQMAQDLRRFESKRDKSL